MLSEEQVQAVDAAIEQIKTIARRHSVREEVVCAAISNTNTVDLSKVVQHIFSLAFVPPVQETETVEAPQADTEVIKEEEKGGGNKKSK